MTRQRLRGLLRVDEPPRFSRESAPEREKLENAEEVEL